MSLLIHKHIISISGSYKDFSTFLNAIKVILSPFFATKGDLMYVSHISKIRKEEVDIAKNVWVQWLITKEHGAKNFAMRLFTVAPGASIPKHQHPWEHEIFVLKGYGIIGAGNEEREVGEGNFAYIQPDVPHWYRNIGDEEWIFLCMIPYLEE